mgnify:CR=1 FL=1
MKTIRLRPGKERSLLRRHPWIFESAIAKGGGDSGETVRVGADGVSVALADQGPLLDDAVLSRPAGLGDARADGSIMTSFVPGDPEDPWEYPVASDPDDIVDEG